MQLICPIFHEKEKKEVKDYTFSEHFKLLGVRNLLNIFSDNTLRFELKHVLNFTALVPQQQTEKDILFFNYFYTDSCA